MLSKRRSLEAIILAFLILLPFSGALAAGTPAGTVISNQAYVDYNDANGNPLTRVFSNTVTTTVTQVAGVDIAPDTATKLAAQGTTVAFPATITNTGNGSDTYDLVVVNILAKVIVALAKGGLAGHVRLGGQWVAAGIIETQVPEVAAALTSAGLRVNTQRQIADWVALMGCRPKEG